MAARSGVSPSTFATSVRVPSAPKSHPRPAACQGRVGEAWAWGPQPAHEGISWPRQRGTRTRVSEPRAVQGGGREGVAGARPGRPRRRSSCRALAVFAFPLVVVWVSLFSFHKRQRAAEGDVFEPSSVHVIPGGPRRRQACRFLGVRLPNGGSPGSGWFSPCWPGAAGTCRDRASDGPQSRRRPEHRDAVLPPARSQPAENSASKSGDAARPRRPAAALLATLPLFLKSFGEACLTE